MQTTGVNIEGVQPPAGREETDVDDTAVSAEYFEAMGIPILRGRNFGPDDGPESPRVVIVSEAAAERFWPEATTGRSTAIPFRFTTRPRPKGPGGR